MSNEFSVKRKFGNYSNCEHSFVRNTMLVFLVGLILSVDVFAEIGLKHNSKKIKIPFHYVQSFIILDVQLERFLPIKLIFDTGAEHTIMFERKWTDVIANCYLREIKVIGSDLQQELPALLTNPINLTFSSKLDFVSPLIVLKDNSTNISQVIGESIHGILSASVFHDYLIEIDYKNKYLILHNKDYTVDPSFKEVEIEIFKNKPYLKTTLKTSSSNSQVLNLLLDTGASLSLLMYSDSNSVVHFPEKIIPGYLGSGLGGMLTGFVGKIYSMTFDTFLLPGVITHFLKIQTSIGRTESQYKDGLIGNQIMDKFTLILDYKREKLFIKPRKNYKQVLDYDKSGMLVISGGAGLQRYYVAYIVANTPASEAGILENDQILKVNGWSVEFFSLVKINSMLQGKSGKKIRLTVLRDGKKMKFSFILKPLI